MTNTPSIDLSGSPMVRQFCRHHHTHVTKSNQTQPHIHPFQQMDIVVAGSLEVVTQNETHHTISKNEGLFIPVLTRHHYHFIEDAEILTLKFHLNPNSVHALHPHVLPFSLEPEIVGVLNHSLRLDQSSESFRQTSIALITLVLSTLPSQAGGKLQDSDWISNLQNLFIRSGQEILQYRVEDMAKACKISSDHFSRKFQQVFHRSPMDFLLNYRLQEAAALLTNEKLPIKEIAERVGYTSVESFTRAFKQNMGESPAKYRKAHR